MTSALWGIFVVLWMLLWNPSFDPCPKVTLYVIVRWLPDSWYWCSAAFRTESIFLPQFFLLDISSVCLTGVMMVQQVYYGLANCSGYGLLIEHIFIQNTSFWVSPAECLLQFHQGTSKQSSLVSLTEPRIPHYYCNSTPSFVYFLNLK